MVIYTFFLFVGAVMFLIDHNQPEVLKRQKQRRAGPDNQLCFTSGHSSPAAAALRHGRAGVPLRWPRAKADL